jgi:hypothetical protein
MGLIGVDDKVPCSFVRGENESCDIENIILEGRLVGVRI